MGKGWVMVWAAGVSRFSFPRLMVQFSKVTVRAKGRTRLEQGRISKRSWRSKEESFRGHGSCGEGSLRGHGSGTRGHSNAHGVSSAHADNGLTGCTVGCCLVKK